MSVLSDFDRSGGQAAALATPSGVLADVALKAPPRGCSPEHLLERALIGSEKFVGDSIGARHVRALIGRIAGTSATALIRGETGTGKEIVAMLLHGNSRRAGGPLVPVNCAAIPEAMVEGELFGYEKGAFSGAVRAYPGKFGLADGGTLFLDEIGELSLAAQAKILRAIESREIFPLGALRSRRCDVRIISATNRDLFAEVAAGRFRADLYYRLAVIQIHIPALAERRGDIHAIARHLVLEIAAAQHCPCPVLTQDALAELQRRPWPGNVRELRNALEHTMVVARDPMVLQAVDLPPTAAASSPLPAESEGDTLLRAIQASGGRKAGAARLLNVSRTTLYRRLERLGCDLTQG